MKIETNNEQGVTVLSLTGSLTIGVGDVALRESVHEALEAGARNILVDLDEVLTVDGSGIGELVGVYTSVSNRGGRLKLCSLPESVTDVLQITQLASIFEVHDARPEAIASFRLGGRDEEAKETQQGWQ